MRTVLPIGAFEPFTPEAIAEMDAAFKAAVILVEKKTMRPASQLTRELLALRIIDTAQRGVHGHDDLCDDAIAYWKRAQMGATSKEPSSNR